MHRKVKELAGGPLVARDGEIGRIEELYFDDREWKVRYLVVDVHPETPGRKVQIPVHAAQPGGAPVRVALSRKEILSAPPADADAPVSLQYQEASTRYYEGTEGAAPLPEAERRANESHLRSTQEVVGYSVHGAGGALGHVDDLVVEDDDWSVVAFVVDGKTIAAGAVQAIEWKTREVRVATGNR